MDGTDGAILGTFTATLGGYGGLTDGQGVLWSVSYGSGLLRYDTKHTVTLEDDDWSTLPLYEAYGVGIDSFGTLWVSQFYFNQVTTISPDGTVVASYPTGGETGDKGVAVNWADNHVWIANAGEPDEGSPTPNITRTVSRLRPDGSIAAVVTLNDTPSIDEEPTGIAVDAAGKVWTTCRRSNYARRIDPDAGTNGLGAVDMSIYLGDGAEPYNYSDMTGYVALGALKQALWNDVYDSHVAGARWARIEWNQGTCDQGANTSIRVQARAAETWA